jgi:hypothetical protein
MRDRTIGQRPQRCVVRSPIKAEANGTRRHSGDESCAELLNLVREHKTLYLAILNLVECYVAVFARNELDEYAFSLLAAVLAPTRRRTARSEAVLLQFSISSYTT